MKRKYKLLVLIIVFAFMIILYVSNVHPDAFQEFRIWFGENTIMILALFVGLPLILYGLYHFGLFTEMRMKMKIFEKASGEKIYNREHCLQISFEYVRLWYDVLTPLKLLFEYHTPKFPNSEAYSLFVWTTGKVDVDHRPGIFTNIPTDKIYPILVNRSNGDPDSLPFKDIETEVKNANHKHFVTRPSTPEFAKNMTEKFVEGMGYSLGLKTDLQKDQAETSKEVKNEENKQ